MAKTLQKAVVKLESVPLAATGAIAWRLMPGVMPYTTTFAVHKSKWKGRLESAIGKPLHLEITDSRGTKTTISDVYIMEEAPSDSPNRVAFIVSDKRWKWERPLIVRDFNIPRKTGDRTADFNSVPVETRAVIDQYDYLPYSLDDSGTTRWTAKRAVQIIMERLEDSKEGGRFKFVSFPIEGKSHGSAGQFTLQGVMLRDQGNVALSRLLAMIPGADVYINSKGEAIIYDSSDLDAVENYFRSLPPSTWAGEKAAWVDRKKVRPGGVSLYFQREVEAVLSYSDDYSGGTQAQKNRNEPYIENVLPTVDPETQIDGEYDPVINQIIPKTVPPGTWVEVSEWLRAMDKDKPDGSMPWNFATIKKHWLKGNLDAVLGGRGLDLDEEANVSMRIQALKQHFRQTFRINRRYMERVRSIVAIRTGLLDPVTGARAPAAVWGQACVIPGSKGIMALRKDPAKAKVYRNVDYLAKSKKAGTKLIATSPGPTRVNIMDRELGIFRLEWINDPAGLTESFVPCHLVGENNEGIPKVLTRDLTKQTTEPIFNGARIEAGTNGLFLRNKLEYKVMLTIIPAAPNNEKQYHRIDVKAKDISSLFQREFRIQGGEGPDLEIFVPPGKATARFAWKDDKAAEKTIQDLLGLKEPDPSKAGIAGTELPGFVLINTDRYLTNYAKSKAAQLLIAYADNVRGTVATRMPERGETLQIVGNMSSTTLRVGTASSAKVDVVHQFPGQQKAIDALALMPETARAIILGTLPLASE